MTLAGCASAVSIYISSRNNYDYRDISSKETLAEQGFIESEYCSIEVDYCIRYLSGKPLLDKRTLSYTVEVDRNGLRGVDSIEKAREDTGEYSGLVVLIHGYRASKEYMANSALYFRFLGFEVVLPDLLLSGDSGTGRQFGAMDGEVIDELITSIKHPDASVLIVGNSMGAVAATRLANLRDDIDGVLLQAPMERFDTAAENYMHAYSPILSSLIPRSSVAKGARMALEKSGTQLEQTDIIPLLQRQETPTLILVSDGDPVSRPEYFQGVNNKYISVVTVARRSHPSMSVINQQDSKIIEAWMDLNLVGLKRPL